MFGYNPINNYLDLAYHPIETAMTNHDDLVHLLVPLGASVNIGLKNCMRAYAVVSEKRTLNDWLENMINIFNDRIEYCTEPQAKAPAVPVDLPEPSTGWQKFCREYHESLKTFPIGEEHASRRADEKLEKEKLEYLERLKKLQEARAYFVEAKQLFDDHGAKTWKKVYKNVESKAINTLPIRIPPTLIPSAKPSPKVELHSYVFLASSHYHSANTVPQHLLSSYDELYEACYVGDNEKIQSLCLPAEGAKSSSISLNISVKMMPGVVDYYNINGKRLPQAI